MGIQQAYNQWAEQYDSNNNPTRDLEARALRQTLGSLPVKSGLEIGCGTGKNSVWLAEKLERLVSVDFSEEMLAKAKEKVSAPHVQFLQADILQPWNFVKEKTELVSFSLVLEHIKDLDPVFRETANALGPGGYVYIGELHPFKQYAGSKARFETAEGVQVVECHTHHISEFIECAGRYGLKLELLKEYFDEEKEIRLPRLLVLLFKKV